MNEITPFSEKDANDSTGFLLWQVTAVWQRSITAVLRPHGITQVQYALMAGLLWLSNKEELITQAMLARLTKLDSMMTSQVLRTLESKGLVERNLHPIDTRAKILSLTKKGKTLARKAIPDVEKADVTFFKTMGLQRKQFNKLLRSLINTSTTFLQSS